MDDLQPWIIHSSQLVLYDITILHALTWGLWKDVDNEGAGLCSYFIYFFSSMTMVDWLLGFCVETGTKFLLPGEVARPCCGGEELHMYKTF